MRGARGRSVELEGVRAQKRRRPPPARHAPPQKQQQQQNAAHRSVNVRRSEKMPPSQGVSSGPKMVAFHVKSSSPLTGLALQPSGASRIAFRSLSSRSVLAVVGDAMFAVLCVSACVCVVCED